MQLIEFATSSRRDLVKKLKTEHAENLSSRVGCKLETGLQLPTAEYTLPDSTQYVQFSHIQNFIHRKSVAKIKRT